MDNMPGLDPVIYVPPPPPITKREYFAAMAMMGHLAWSPPNTFEQPEDANLARNAVLRADALIAALSSSCKECGK